MGAQPTAVLFHSFSPFSSFSDRDCTSNPRCDPVTSFCHRPGVEKDGTGLRRPPSSVDRPTTSTPSFAGHISVRHLKIWFVFSCFLEVFKPAGGKPWSSSAISPAFISRGYSHLHFPWFLPFSPSSFKKSALRADLPTMASLALPEHLS